MYSKENLPSWINIKAMKHEFSKLKDAHAWRLRFSSLGFLFLTSLNNPGITQPLPSHQHWGDQRVRVAAACSAFSMLPNDPQNITLEWRGPCEAGLAHGDGTQIIRMQSIALSVSQATYVQGRVVKYRERYVFELGNLLLKSESDPSSSIGVTIGNLPKWASELALAATDWANWRRHDIEKRQNEVTVLQGNAVESRLLDNEETPGEKNHVDQEPSPSRHRIF